jgi:hypothetical protein
MKQPESAKIQLRLDQMKKECDAFSGGVALLLRATDGSAGPYNELAEDKSAVGHLNIGQFLSKGKAVIEAGVGST